MKVPDGWRALLGASICLFACGNTTHNEPRAAAGGADGADAADRTPTCENATFDTESGVETCGSGERQFQHRVRAGTGCSYDAALLDTCNLNDCAASHAYCVELAGKSVCATGCAVDLDCGEREICQCLGHGLGGRCMASDCQSDADCRGDAKCSTFRSVCHINAVYACAVQGDQCLVDADCTAPTPYCLPIPIPDGAGSWNHLCVEALPCPE